MLPDIQVGQIRWHDRQLTFSDCRSRDSTTLKNGLRSSFPRNSDNRGRLDFATCPFGKITASRGSNSLRCRRAPPTSVKCIACLHTTTTTCRRARNPADCINSTCLVQQAVHDRHCGRSIHACHAHLPIIENAIPGAVDKRHCQNKLQKESPDLACGRQTKINAQLEYREYSCTASCKDAASATACMAQSPLERVALTGSVNFERSCRTHLGRLRSIPTRSISSRSSSEIWQHRYSSSSDRARGHVRCMAAWYSARSGASIRAPVPFRYSEATAGAGRAVLSRRTYNASRSVCSLPAHGSTPWWVHAAQEYTQTFAS